VPVRVTVICKIRQQLADARSGYGREAESNRKLSEDSTLAVKRNFDSPHFAPTKPLSITDKPKCTCAAGDGAYLAGHSENCVVTKFARRAAASSVGETRMLAANLLRELVIPAPKQIQDAWEDLLTERINQFVLERVCEQRNRAERLEKEWHEIDIKLRRVEAEHHALKDESLWTWSILTAFTLSLFVVSFIVATLMQQTGN
jgi:hypothetical protein